MSLQHDIPLLFRAWPFSIFAAVVVLQKRDENKNSVGLIIPFAFLTVPFAFAMAALLKLRTRKLPTSAHTVARL